MWGNANVSGFDHEQLHRPRGERIADVRE